MADSDSENVKLTLQRLTVLELQQELKRRGLKKSGVKAKLVERLFDYMQIHGYQVPGAKSEPPNASREVINPEMENSNELVFDQSHDDSNVSVDEFMNPVYQDKNPRDFAEEFTEPIHQTEQVNNLPNRVIEMDKTETKIDEGCVHNSVLALHHQHEEIQHSEGEDNKEEVDNALHHDDASNQSEEKNEPIEDENEEQEMVDMSENKLDISMKETEQNEKVPIDSDDREEAVTGVLHNDTEEALDYGDEEHQEDEKTTIENDEKIEIDDGHLDDEQNHHKITVEEKEDGEVIEESVTNETENQEYENGIVDSVTEQIKIKKIVTPVTLKKRVSLQASVESAEEKAARRKRRWGSTSIKDSVTISTDSMKILMPDVKIDASTIDSIPELDYQEDDITQENMEEVTEEKVVLNDDKISPNKKRRTVKVDAGKKIIIGKLPSDEAVVVVSDSADVLSPKPVVTRSVRSVEADDDTDEQVKRDRSPSPAKNTPSCYMHIDNLVRPYTITQLKNLIQKTGTIEENQFWINNIKSHCYVMMSNVEEATATRQALHGISWPSGSPKKLKVDFAAVEKIWSETNGAVGEKPKVVIEIEDKENEAAIKDERTKRTDRETAKKSHDEEKRKRQERNEKRSNRERKEPSKKREGRDESPAKLLDDLFRKTKATPCIYWLPLTDAQIAERVKKHGENSKPETTRITERPRDIKRRPERRYSPVRRSPPRRMNDRGWR